MIQACKKAHELLVDTGVFKEGNHTLKKLLDISYMLTQRTVVHYPTEDGDSRMEFTAFGNQLSGTEGSNDSCRLHDSVESIGRAFQECQEAGTSLPGLVGECEKALCNFETVLKSRKTEWEEWCNEMQSRMEQIRLHASLLNTGFQATDVGGLLLLLPETLP